MYYLIQNTYSAQIFLTQYILFSPNYPSYKYLPSRVLILYWRMDLDTSKNLNFFFLLFYEMFACYGNSPFFVQQYAIESRTQKKTLLNRLFLHENSNRLNSPSSSLLKESETKQVRIITQKYRSTLLCKYAFSKFNEFNKKNNET